MFAFKLKLFPNLLKTTISFLDTSSHLTLKLANYSFIDILSIDSPHIARMWTTLPVITTIRQHILAHYLLGFVDMQSNELLFAVGYNTSGGLRVDSLIYVFRGVSNDSLQIHVNLSLTFHYHRRSQCWRSSTVSANRTLELVRKRHSCLQRSSSTTYWSSRNYVSRSREKWPIDPLIPNLLVDLTKN